MTTRLIPFLLLATTGLLLPTTGPAQPAAITGQQLAAQLRNLQPTTNASYSGILQIKRDGQKPESHPCTTRIETRGDSWETVYIAQPPQSVHTLRVIHRLSGTNEYHYSQTTPAAPQPTQTPPLTPGELTRPFANSDFSLSDLGQEHFHWPHQEILKHEMRISRSCKVLESKPAPTTPTPYSRVLSWIDNETGALVIAEAYNQEGRLLKEFYVRKIEKVGGYYQPEQLQMEDVINGSRTRLTFKFE